MYIAQILDLWESPRMTKYLAVVVFQPREIRRQRYFPRPILFGVGLYLSGTLSSKLENLGAEGYKAGERSCLYRSSNENPLLRWQGSALSNM